MLTGVLKDVLEVLEVLEVLGTRPDNYRLLKYHNFWGKWCLDHITYNVYIICTITINTWGQPCINICCYTTYPSAPKKSSVLALSCKSQSVF